MKEYSNFDFEEKKDGEEEVLIFKIKKLFTLYEKHPDTPEGMTALKMANELLTKYNLDKKDLNKSVIQNGKLIFNKKQHLVIMSIFSHVAKNNFCLALFNSKNFNSVKFLGKPINIQVSLLLSQYIYNYGCLVAEQYKNKRENEAFWNGYTQTIVQRLNESSEGNWGVEEKNAIRLLKDSATKEIEEYLKSQGIRTKSVNTSSSTYDAEAFSNGVRSGEKINLNRQVNQSKSVLRLE